MTQPPADHPTLSHEAERWRESIVMALYVAIVLLAALVALPSDYDTDHGDLGLLAIVWGTTIGLAVTHWFAFVLAAASVNAGTPSEHERDLAKAQLLGASVVAAVTTIPLLLAKPDTSLAAASLAPAVIIGIAGFGVGRARGHSRAKALLAGLVISVLGVAIAALKIGLTGGH